MEESIKKRRGRPAIGERRTFSLSFRSIAYLDAMPEGERSKYVNRLIENDITEKEKTEMRTANLSDIQCAIHCLWERGWAVSEASVQEMLEKGYKVSPLSQPDIISQIRKMEPHKNDWLEKFNWQSPHAVAHPRPWPVGADWHQQKPENN